VPFDSHKHCNGLGTNIEFGEKQGHGNKAVMIDYSDSLLGYLIEKAARGDREAATALISHPEILQLLDKVSSWAAWKYNQDKDDIRQDVSIALWKSIGSLRNPKHLKSWCYTVAKRYCYHKVRHSKVEMAYIQRQSVGDRRHGGDAFVQATDVLTPDVEFLVGEELRRATSQFPQEIVDGLIQGRSAKQISQETGRPVASVYRLLKNITTSILEGTLSDIKTITELEKGVGDTATISVDLIHVIEAVKELSPDLIAHLQSHERDLDRLRWDVFEHLVAEFFASSGFQDVRLVGRNSKTSADIFASYFIDSVGMRNRYFIEVKRWKKRIGVQIIDQVYGAMLNERPMFGWHAAMIVSLVGFTDFEKYNRESLALKGVELRDRNDLLRWLRDYKRNRSGLWLPEPRTGLELRIESSE
jgi:DNA-directed RNA polymerase specialized sigma24 family protein